MKIRWALKRFFTPGYFGKPKMSMGREWNKQKHTVATFLLKFRIAHLTHLITTTIYEIMNPICFCILFVLIWLKWFLVQNKKLLKWDLGNDLNIMLLINVLIKSSFFETVGNFDSQLKYGFCNKFISERWNSDQLNTFYNIFVLTFGRDCWIQ